MCSSQKIAGGQFGISHCLISQNNFLHSCTNQLFSFVAEPPTYQVPEVPDQPPPPSPAEEDQPIPVLILVITMAIAVLVLIIVIGVCVALKKQKAKGQGATEAANSSFSSGGCQGAPEVQRPFIINPSTHHPSTLKVSNNNAKFTMPLPAVPPTYTHTVHPAVSSPRSLGGRGFDSGHGSNDCSGSTVVGDNQYEVPYSHLLQLQQAEKHQRQYTYFAQHFPRVQQGSSTGQMLPSYHTALATSTVVSGAGSNVKPAPSRYNYSDYESN